MLTNLMKKSISAFEKHFKGRDVEIRNVYTLEYFERDKRAKFKIEFTSMVLNKYFYVIIFIDDMSKELYIYDIIEC